MVLEAIVRDTKIKVNWTNKSLETNKKRIIMIFIYVFVDKIPTYVYEKIDTTV